MKTLTIISTIFIPLTFITGVYGMNFEVAANVIMLTVSICETTSKNLSFVLDSCAVYARAQLAVLIPNFLDLRNCYDHVTIVLFPSAGLDVGSGLPLARHDKDETLMLLRFPCERPAPHLPCPVTSNYHVNKYVRNLMIPAAR